MYTLYMNTAKTKQPNVHQKLRVLNVYILLINTKKRSLKSKADRTIHMYAFFSLVNVFLGWRSMTRPTLYLIGLL